MTLFDELQWRGLVYDSTEGLPELFARESITAYIGFDPTAASLHVGSLLPILTLARLQRGGHTPLALVGGGTGLIGDPKPTTERALLTREQVDQNVAGIAAQLSRFLAFDDGPHRARLVDNGEWLRTLGAIDFMRDVGKHFTVNAMLAKESVRRRIEAADGISYTEFSYALLQAYDFVTLYDRHQCTLQMGGSDQWGNITAGIDLVRRLRGARVHGLVSPLITTSSGTKFGKTEAGAVWLDPALTSPFRFFQFWLNTNDRDVGRYLRFFTWLDHETLTSLEGETAAAPERREAARVLAREVTRIVHGEAETRTAERAAALLFGATLADATVEEILAVFDDVPSLEVRRQQFDAGLTVIDLLVSSGLAASRGEAGRVIKQGGVYVNDERWSDERGVLTVNRLVGGELLVLRRGARERRIVRAV